MQNSHYFTSENKPSQHTIKVNGSSNTSITAIVEDLNGFIHSSSTNVMVYIHLFYIILYYILYYFYFILFYFILYFILSLSFFFFLYLYLS